MPTAMVPAVHGRKRQWLLSPREAASSARRPSLLEHFPPQVLLHRLQFGLGCLKGNALAIAAGQINEAVMHKAAFQGAVGIVAFLRK